MNIPNVSSYLEILYEDLATISRHQEVVNAKHQTIPALVEIYSNVPCRLSKAGKGGYSSNGETRNSTQMDMMLFTGPKVDIKFGDEVTVVKKGRTFKLKIGKPFEFESSLQTPCEVIVSA